MLDLDSSTWSKLEHACGSAADIPQLIVDLDPYAEYSNSDSEPFFALWSALCHQGDTCTAAYAAVPHILRLAKRAPEKIHYSFLLLPASIEIARLAGRGPEIPKDLEEPYAAAIRSMGTIIAERDPGSMDETWALVAAAAIAVSAGHATHAEAILELEGESAREFLEWKASW